MNDRTLKEIAEDAAKLNEAMDVTMDEAVNAVIHSLKKMNNVGFPLGLTHDITTNPSWPRFKKSMDACFGVSWYEQFYARHLRRFIQLRKDKALRENYALLRTIIMQESLDAILHGVNRDE